MIEPIYYGTMQYVLIYIFEIPDDAHKHYLKIGMTNFSSSSSYKQLPPNCDELNNYAHIRIKQYTKEALVSYNLLYTELARKQVRLPDGTIETSSFNDHDVHEVLDRSGYDVHKFYDTGKDSEWYKVELQPAIYAIRAVKEGRSALSAFEKGGAAISNEVPSVILKPRITLREEQERCVRETATVFKSQSRMLWDCKMRFGKTITAYSLVKCLGYKKVIVVTHRPAVVDSWRSDFDLIFTEGDYTFLTKANIKEDDKFSAEDAGIDAENDRILMNYSTQGRLFVYFASMQDLRGSKIAGGKYEKNKAVFGMEWDLIIYDEAHEGTQTELGLNVQRLLEKEKNGKTPKKVLQLSGTPYNLLNQYEDENVFSWDYVQEQDAKKKWELNHPGEFNPYAELPQLRICTFDLRDKMPTSYRFEDEGAAFNFREFFRTWTGDIKRDLKPMPKGASIGDFVYENDVIGFLDLISTDSTESNYPFSTQEYRDIFQHTFWILPGVKEARALSTLLQIHPVFRTYKIVNVAGEGDVEQPYEDALRAVRSAIKQSHRTITLSCGKLTTGVTVKEWTGVMLLSGSANTAAMGYMQTIFRVQSAGSIDGKQKQVCYAFDFAPDRTLKVISEVHNLRKSSKGSDDTNRAQLEKFLNFCPVLSEAGTGMTSYDVPKMMRQLKRLTVESAVKSGFDDESIYKSDAGIVMDKDKLLLVNDLKNTLSPQKKAKRITSIDVNKQGMTNEQYEKAQNAKRKPKKERTKEDLEALEKERRLRKQQKQLFDLLRNISIRLPLLIYGTATDFDESIRLEDFVNKVDNISWETFLPKGVSKEKFLKLLVFYDEDVIEGAGMRIRRMAKAADEMYPTQRVIRLAEIFNCFKNPAKETVLTPWRVVNMHMGDTIGGYNFYDEEYSVSDGMLQEPRLKECGDTTANLFLNDCVKILEMNSKSGLYPLYLTYSIYRLLLPKPETQLSLQEASNWWQKALDEHLFVLCQTKMAVSITERTLVGYTGMKVHAECIPRLIDRMQDKKRLANKVSNPVTWGMKGDKMRFDAIVGNPPYNLEGASGGTNDAPIYQHFAQLAMELKPEYISLIMPSRWFSAGRENLLGEFRAQMLTDRNIRNMHVYTDSHEVFTSVEIKGGICYYLQDRSYNGPCEYTLSQNGETTTMMRELGEFDILIRDPRLAEIVKKVVGQTPTGQTVDTMISGDTPFGIPTNPKKSGKNRTEVSDVRTDEFQTTLLYWENNERVIGYVDKNRIKKNTQDISRVKVFIPEAAGSGNDPLVIGKPQLMSGESVCSQTFLYTAFDTEKEAFSFISYLKTKFFRALVSAYKISQHTPSKTYRFVPIQDFSLTWTDDMLYEKYGLSKDDINFIENTIQPVDWD